MITDEIVEVIDRMIELCSDEKQKIGMKSVREMLCDYNEPAIYNLTSEQIDQWIKSFLSC